MPDMPALKGLVIGTAGRADMEAGSKVFARAMGRGGALVEERLLQFAERLLEAGIGHFVAARHKRKIVGYGSLVVYANMGWIGFMGTDPTLQGRGIGAAIMEYVLQLAESLGLKTLKLDATNIGKKLYSRFGFREEYPARMYEIPGVCSRGTRRDSVGSVAFEKGMPGWCLAMDRRAFGDDRSPLFRTSLEHGAKLLIIENRGFGLLDGKKLGPLVATDPGAAMDILRSGSELGASMIYVPNRPGLPREFLSALRLPEEYGPITCCTRMHLGDPVEQDLDLAYADYSAATG